MSAPTSYTVSYDFSGFQSLNPADPLPAAEIDVEFAGIEASLTSVIAALADVRRADGRLENGVVTWDGLDADVRSRITGEDRVTVGDLNAGAFAAQPEAESGVANDKIMTPLRTKQALDALRALSSQAQAEAGTNNDTVTTPLRVKQALDALRALASQAQAEAGSDNATVVTPLRVAQALAALRPRFTATVNLTWGSIAAGASAEQTISLTGALVNDRVAVGLPDGLAAGLLATAWVSSSNNVKVRLTNITGGALTPHAGAATPYAVTALRY